MVIKMKRLICIFIFTLLCCAFCGVRAYADEQDELLEEIGVDTEGLNDNLPDSVNDYLEENDLSVKNTEKMTSITPKDVFAYVWEQFKIRISLPLKTLAGIIGVILISSLAGSLSDTITDKSLTKVYNIISVIIAVNVICAPVSECIADAADTLNSGGEFMIGYIPVFTGITASAGNVTSAMSYSAVIIMASEAAVQLASNYIMPVLSICMALGVVEAVNPSFSLSGITAGIKKAASVMLGFVMTIFVGLLTVQSIVGASADTIGVKAAKFMVSNFVPVIGGAVADAYSTLRTSLGLLRGGVGFIGIISISLLVLPVVLEVVAMKAAIFIGEILTDMFGLAQLKILMKNTSQLLTLTVSILICFFVILVFSTTVVMMIGLNIA
jgi:stage III sporulation protein AE